MAGIEDLWFACLAKTPIANVRSAVPAACLTTTRNIAASHY
jgi:hypothetical protein